MVERPQSDESAQNRPYRRFVGAVFALIILVIAVVVLRGIIRRLDRLPSPDRVERPEIVDDRALRACADDLAKLEQAIRTEAGRGFSDVDPLETWKGAAQRFEVERVRIVARCHLDDIQDNAVASDLADASSAVEAMLRSYGLLLSRHDQDGVPASKEAREATRRALEALKAR